MRPKSGKTSLFGKVVKKVYGDVTKGLVLAFEKGYNALEIVAQDINEFNEFIEVVNQLITEKDELPFKMIAIDTVDIMYKQAVNYVLKRESRKDGKKYLAINDIPWGKGHELVDNLISEQIDKLKKAGYGLFFITHDKDKRFESRDGVSYDKTTCSLPTRIRETILNAADFICFIDIAKEKNSQGKLIDKRYIYFRSDGADLEAGSRFENVPMKIPYDIDLFIETFENAVKSSFGNSVDIDKIKKEQKQQREKEIKEFIEKQKQPTNEELVEIIKSKFADLDVETKTKVKTIMDDYSITTFKNPEKLNHEALIKIVELIK